VRAAARRAMPRWWRWGRSSQGSCEPTLVMVEINASPGFDKFFMAGQHWSCLLIPTRIPPQHDSPPLVVVEHGDRVELRLGTGVRYMFPVVLAFAVILVSFVGVFVIVFIDQGKQSLAIGTAMAGACFGGIMISVMLLGSPRAGSAELLCTSMRSSVPEHSGSDRVRTEGSRVHGVRLVDCWIGYRSRQFRFRQLQVQVDRDGQLEWRLVAQSGWGLAGPGRAFASACGVGFEHLTIEGTQGLTPEQWRSFCSERLAATPREPTGSA
jgi:hypothetical protein